MNTIHLNKNNMSAVAILNTQKLAKYKSSVLSTVNQLNAAPVISKLIRTVEQEYINCTEQTKKLNLALQLEILRLVYVEVSKYGVTPDTALYQQCCKRKKELKKYANFNKSKQH